MKQIYFFFAFFCISPLLLAQSRSIQVHFLYGSRPIKAYKSVERPWFGGIHGGHVGLSLTNADSVISFSPKGTFHYLAQDKNRHSQYVVTSLQDMKMMFDHLDLPVQYACVTIPLTEEQYQKAKAATQTYLQQTPYDYAFLGMRCAAAAYDILAQADIVKPLGRNRLVLTIFYPRRLRKRIFRMAAQKHYAIATEKGRNTRKWEKD